MWVRIFPVANQEAPLDVERAASRSFFSFSFSFPLLTPYKYISIAPSAIAARVLFFPSSSCFLLLASCSSASTTSTHYPHNSFTCLSTFPSCFNSVNRRTEEKPFTPCTLDQLHTSELEQNSQVSSLLFDIMISHYLSWLFQY